MNDLEHTLPAQLRHLADDLAPGSDPVAQAGAARARYRRQRRTRAGMAGLAAAVVAIVIGVPTTMGALSSAPDPSGQVAGPGTETTAPEDSSSWTAEREAREARSAAEQARDAEAAAAQAALAELGDEEWSAFVPLLAPLPLTAPPDLAGCPDAAATLSSSLGLPLQYWHGQLPGGPAGCVWGTGDPATPSSPPDRHTVSIGFLVGTTAEQLQAGVHADTGGTCGVLDTPQVAAGAALQVCDGDEETRWWLNVPDTSGAGVWVLGATLGDRASGPGGAASLAALAEVAWAAWGG
ncbi:MULTISPECIES: hypothetical protein [unclassified Modestobacter]